jgi:hypothetical protein
MSAAPRSFGGRSYGGRFCLTLRTRCSAFRVILFLCEIFHFLLGRSIVASCMGRYLVFIILFRFRRGRSRRSVLPRGSFRASFGLRLGFNLLFFISFGGSWLCLPCRSRRAPIGSFLDTNALVVSVRFFLLGRCRWCLPFAGRRSCRTTYCFFFFTTTALFFRLHCFFLRCRCSSRLCLTRGAFRVDSGFGIGLFFLFLGRSSRCFLSLSR